MSVAVDYAFGLFCSSVLRTQRLGFVEEHTLKYKFAANAASDDGTRRPESNEEFARTIPSLFGRDTPLPFTVPFQVWEEICRDRTHLNRLFRRASGHTREISPVFLRLQCTNPLAIDRPDFVKMIVWRNLDPQLQSALARYLESTPDLILLFFIEWITGEWGIKALENSECPNIVICGTTGNAKMIVHRRARTLELGKFRQPEDLIRKLKAEIQRFLNQRYG
jgi:hypothetical protein